MFLNIVETAEAKSKTCLQSKKSKVCHHKIVMLAN